MTYNPAFYKDLNIPDYNPNSVPFVNYNPMKEQKPIPFSEFQPITTSVPEAPKMKVFSNSGSAGIKFDPKMVTPSPFDLSGVKFNPNDRNFLRGFNPNSFANKVQPFQVQQVTASTAGRDWDGGWPGLLVMQHDINKDVVSVNKCDESGGVVKTNEKVESGIKYIGNNGKNSIFSSSGKSWDGSWPEGDVKEFSSKATESWNSAVGAKQDNKNWKDNSGDFSNKATDSWNKALNRGKNQGTKNGQEEVDEIIQRLIAVLEKLRS
ncbi:uncharacterized protein LOC133182758 [Saccostrea echinata]|uniref:uncharacterized protein LOC133182758 n=1 Tax=Saccostrea echinata TaxID=191078 RepID=UPI002A81F92F|nr:uncharacterized protein LOC133182758 [Saccostrea echinata]